jgi:Rieske 2Fe-2S family protein
MTSALDHLDRAWLGGPRLDPSWLDPAGTDPDGLDRALQTFGYSRMLPAAAYTSPEVLAWERRYLFAGTWTCVGRESDLRRGTETSGDATHRALVVGDVAVLLTWVDGHVRAFANTCRHRGHELLADSETSTKRSIVCPYHGWSYDLTGSLRTAPSFQTVPGFDPTEHKLVRLPLERWRGWLFVHAANAADIGAPVEFAEFIGDLEPLVAPYRPEELVLGERHHYEVAANWKVVTENYHECYHCPLIHPALCQVSPPNSGENYQLPGAWAGGPMDLRPGVATMSITGDSLGRPIPGANPRVVQYLGLLPNLLISAHPDYVMAHRLLPLAPDRTWVECSWYFPASGEHEIDPRYAVEFWDLTNGQDWAACESVQRGLRSPHFRPGPFGPREAAVHRFVTLIGRAYRGLPLHV